MSQVPPPSAAFLAENRQPAIYAASITTWVLAVTAAMLRILARRLKRFHLWYDDWLVLVALGFASGFNVVLIVWMGNGLGRHYQVVPPERISPATFDLFIEDVLYSCTLAMSKLSFLFFYWRIFTGSAIKRPLKILMALVVCWLTARLFSLGFHCIPFQHYWDPNVKGYCGVNDRLFFLGTVSAHLTLDVTILLLPIPFIKQLHVTMTQKFAITGMFMLGGFICIATIVQLVKCANLDVTSPDVTWTLAPIGLWASVEANLSIVSACLPSLRPIALLLFRGSVDGSRDESTKRWTGANGSTSKSKASKFNLPGKSFTRGFQTIDTDSTQQIHGKKDPDEESGGIDSDAMWDTTPCKHDVTVAADPISLDDMNVNKDRILVKDEIRIDTESQ